MGEADQEETEVFRPTSGRVSGALAMLVAGLVVAVAVLDGEGGFGPRIATAAVLGGTLAWASMLRPRVLLGGDQLVLRNMVETVRIPLAAVEELVVRQVLAVRAGDRRYVSPAVGRPLRKVVRNKPVQHDPARPPTEVPYADYVEQRIRRRAEDARSAAGVRRGSTDQVALAAGVRREPAVLPIALLVLATLAFVASFLL